MCPLETPKAQDRAYFHLATFARINEYGFIEAPYRGGQKGRQSHRRNHLHTAV
jgi:DNA-directed RNA polymerase beta subunit